MVLDKLKKAISPRNNRNKADTGKSEPSEGKDVAKVMPDNDNQSSNNSGNNHEMMMARNQNVEITASNRILFDSPAPSIDGLEEDDEDSSFTDASDLSRGGRQIWIVTTAALPWRTGTAVNPLLRALALIQTKQHSLVALVIPWLADEAHRQKLYGMHASDLTTPAAQTEFIRQYCLDKCNATPEMVEQLHIQYWEGSYNPGLGSIFPTQDICSLIPNSQADVAILEEPEHLNWFRHSDGTLVGWIPKFNHVVGILHTNYAAYIRQYGAYGASFVQAKALNALSAMVITGYCHKCIRLSPTLPSLVNPILETTCNVHGVNHAFLEKSRLAQEALETKTISNSKNAAVDEQKIKASGPSVYFVGKIIWAKGFDKILEVQERYKALSDEYFPMNVYGTGDDLQAIQLAFHGRRGNGNADLTKGSVEKEGTAPTSDQATSKDDNETKPPTTKAGDGVETGSASAVETPADTTETSDQSYGTFSSSNVFCNPQSLRDQILVERSSSRSIKVERTPEEEQPLVVPSAPSFPDVLGHLTEKTVQSGAETADAALKLVESVLEHGIGVMTGGGTQDRQTADESTVASPSASPPEENSGDEPAPTTSDEVKKAKDHKKRHQNNHFPFLPARSRFKWRKEAIPAKFWGVQDHVDVSLDEYIFLNMSTTEVLCTTSAEALAMGKFVILPKHRK